MRILVLEDEARLARHVASALTEAGHDPVMIRNGEAALAAVEQATARVAEHRARAPA